MSTAPIARSQPLLCQIQCAGILYVRVLRNEYNVYAFKLVLSAIAPETIVVAVVENES